MATIGRYEKHITVQEWQKMEEEYQASDIIDLTEFMATKGWTPGHMGGWVRMAGPEAPKAEPLPKGAKVIIGKGTKAPVSREPKWVAA